MLLRLLDGARLHLGGPAALGPAAEAGVDLEQHLEQLLPAAHALGGGVVEELVAQRVLVHVRHAAALTRLEHLREACAQRLARPVDVPWVRVTLALGRDGVGQVDLLDALALVHLEVERLGLRLRADG
eukprot:scaffold78558_cov70-Phaeocystis_antarctica.AAC.3